MKNASCVKKSPTRRSANHEIPNFQQQVIGEYGESFGNPKGAPPQNVQEASITVESVGAGPENLAPWSSKHSDS